MTNIPLTQPCRIIGVLDKGPAGLTPAALAHIEAADLVIGGSRLLDLCADRIAAQAERRDLTGHLASVPGWISEALGAGKQVVVLATGDPLFHGIASYLRSRLPDLSLEILPTVSTVQLACARLGLAWQDFRVVSVHGRNSGEWQEGAGPEHGLYPILQALQGHHRLAILTSPDNSPDRIARMLVQEGLGDSVRLAVASRLGWADEQVIADRALAEAAAMTFAEPNLVILSRQAHVRSPVLFGLADEAFRQRQPDRGLITKREARALSLARLQLSADSIVWDIGAGSGAVGLEAARLCPLGFVHAIEKNPEDAAIARENRRRFGIHNYRMTQARAPQGMADWPDPDAVFIGGSGGELAELIRLALSRLRDQGWLVMNFVTFENLHLAMTQLKERQARWDITQLQASRGRPILDMHRLAAENPVWILAATRGDDNDH
jgi:precorrin-6Y C5,15-methyltransferase (decarboxylating)